MNKKIKSIKYGGGWGDAPSTTELIYPVVMKPKRKNTSMKSKRKNTSKKPKRKNTSKKPKRKNTSMKSKKTKSNKNKKQTGGFWGGCKLDFSSV